MPLREAPNENAAITEDEKRAAVDTEKKDKLFKIFDKYQEESAVLDPSLTMRLHPLVECV